VSTFVPLEKSRPHRLQFFSGEVVVGAGRQQQAERATDQHQFRGVLRTPTHLDINQRVRVGIAVTLVHREDGVEEELRERRGEVDAV